MPDPLDLAYPYALDAVSDAERDDIERQLAADGELARTFTTVVRDIRDTMGELSVLDATDPAPELESRILAELDRLRPATVVPITRTAHRRRWLAAAAAAVVAAGIGGGILAQQHATRVTGPPSAEQILHQPDSHAASTPLNTGGTLTVRASPGMGAATVAFDDIPAAPDGRVYQLWVVPPSGAPRSAGVLDRMPTPAAPLVTTYRSGDTLAVTVEPAGGSPAPTTTPIGAVPMS
ncbi:putative anti-sigma-K factor RskA [Nocardia nova SH22a]|uniref:Regulator of SigK n=1 Tax=Nocardia nova SH22a TaxID=1415166 RepID=W5TRR2_9NOCA|nr:anti-sigma factor [Nocardia nova]AHH22065.1 putative anti-sigma-K factor RskA [Nocardia nova SH22a]